MTASVEDRKITSRIKAACEIFGIRLLDHLIIGPGGFMSFNDEGIL